MKDMKACGMDRDMMVSVREERRDKYEHLIAPAWDKKE